jgi:hypothetical protein
MPAARPSRVKNDDGSAVHSALPTRDQTRVPPQPGCPLLSPTFSTSGRGPYAASTLLRGQMRASGLAYQMRPLGTIRRCRDAMRTASAFTNRKRARRGLKARLMRVVLSALVRMPAAEAVVAPRRGRRQLAWHSSGAKARDPGPTDTFLWAQHSNRGHHGYDGSRGVFGSSGHTTP